jgi:hypothetical protein
MKTTSFFCIDFDDNFWVDFFIKQKFYKPDIWIERKEFTKKKFQKNFKNSKFIDWQMAIRGQLKIKKEYILNRKEEKYYELCYEKLYFTLKRYEKYDDKISKVKKREYIKKQFIKWKSFIKENKPDVVMFKSIPHHGFDLIIYHICKFHKIKTIIFNKLNFRGYAYLSHNYNEKNIRKILKEQRLKQSNFEIQYKEFNINFLKKCKKEYNQNIPYYINYSYINQFSLTKIIILILKCIKNFFFKNSISLINFNNNLKLDQRNDLDSFQLSMIYLKSYFTILDKFIFYKTLCENVNYDEKYILFSASYQPERTTSTDCDKNFYDQYKILKFLDKNLPKNLTIFYKEHPSMFSMNRVDHDIKNINYYKKIQNGIKRVKFISTDIDTYKLIDNAEFVVSANGTINIESMIRNKRSIIFSQNYLKLLNGITFISNKKDLRIFLKNYKKNYKKNYLSIINDCPIIPELSIDDFYNDKIKNFDINKRYKKIANLINKFL